MKLRPFIRFVCASSGGLLLVLGLSGCSPDADSGSAAVSSTVSINRTLPDPARLQQHIEMLASDGFGGRLPGTLGEEKTVAYLVEQFRLAGLQPGNPNGSYVQNVPLVGITAESTLSIAAGGSTMALAPRTDFVAGTSQVVEQLQIRDSEMVFVGYGVQAPEYGWDDYRQFDPRGKTLVMLINDPPVQTADGTLDRGMFKAEAMTYYGRWTYKYEIASKLGAAAVLIIHDTEGAGYPWDVVANSWSGESFELAREDGNRGRVPLQGWLSQDAGRQLFARAGVDFEAARIAARTSGFVPIPLAARLDATINTQIREVDSQNVVGLLPGSGAKTQNEYLVFSAHWDHLGSNADHAGDAIFNGAVDNATGTAALIELARCYARSTPGPSRSLLFIAVTAEEQGLLGSRYYSEHPLYPLTQTVANLNMDAISPWGLGEEIEVIGHGQSSLDEVVRRVAAEQRRSVVADRHAQRGYYFRSDQFSFARQGVPGLYVTSGGELRGKPAGSGERARADYLANRYHKPADEIDPASWDYAALAEEVSFYYLAGFEVANAEDWPRWNEGSEFKAIREASLATAATQTR